MKRRGNKSNKVPGVKLRPAQEGAYARVQRTETCWVEDSQRGSDDAVVSGHCARPFKGVVVCATGLEKSTLFKMALDLGAESTSAFTNHVTHLIAANHGGAKYKCALERKTPILRPAWITESHNIWRMGDDVVLEASVDAHRLPIFSGVVICLAGDLDLKQRALIRKLTIQNEGQFSKNLERPVKVTHLLCSGEDTTEKMLYAQKFNSSKEADIKLVWEDWFWDCLEYGGRFDETEYDVRRPRLGRKKLAPSFNLSNNYESNANPSQNPPPPPQMDDDFEEEPANVRVLPSVTLQLWGSLLEKRGYQITGGNVICSPSKSQGQAQPHEHPESPTRAAEPRRSVISSFRRANSFAPLEQKSPTQRLLPFRRTVTSSSMFVPQNQQGYGVAGPSRMAADTTHIKLIDDTDGSGSHSPTIPIFAGMTFRVLGEAKGQNVRLAVEQRGGVVVPDDEDDVDFILVRLVSGSKLFRLEGDESLRLKYRTECWLERCIYEDRVCPVDGDVSFVPLGIETPVPGAESLTVSISGFDASVACGIKRLLRALGVTLSTSFSRRSTHLLCPSGAGQKYEKACEWETPVVNLAWIKAFTTTGVIPVLDESLVAGNSSIPRGFGKAKQHPDKEKGKARVMINAQDRHPEPHPAPRVPLLTRNDTSTIPSGSFGQASALPPFADHPSSIPAPTQSCATPVIQYDMARPSSSAASQRESAPVIDMTQNVPPGASVPSSRTPSPMKVGQLLTRGPSSSPLKIDADAAKALQESITSLLGKRTTSEGDDVARGKPTKRTRPRRRKLQTRQASAPQHPGGEADPPVLFGFVADAPPFEAYYEPGLVEDQREESMRVVYEDPGQREEKKRLMSLLQGQPVDGLSTPSSIGRTRRSSRIAGF